MGVNPDDTKYCRDCGISYVNGPDHVCAGKPECKGIEISHGVWSGCTAASSGLKDCPACGDQVKPANPFRADAKTTNLYGVSPAMLAVPFQKAENLKNAKELIVGPEITATDVLRRLAGLPTEAKARKAIPIFTGVLKYFPDALAAVAELSRIGNDQHNPGQPLHWDKTKSTDHLDCLTRHLLEAGTDDTDGVRHSAKVAWRALANLQTEIDKGG